MLLPRVLTAAVGLPLVLLLIYVGGLAWTAFVAAVCILCLYEYGLILAVGGRPVQRWVVIFGGAALALSVALGGPSEAVLTAVVALITLREMFGKVRSLERLAFTLFGTMFLGWMPAHLALIRGLRPDGQALTFTLFVVVWLTDTAAYAAGKAFGSHKLAQGLSPKKTWEGVVAGFLCAAGGAVLMTRLLAPEGVDWRWALGLGALIGLCGQLSDLAQSMVKRAVGVKDSGSILPGHGGVMDRFDSFILAAPAVYYLLKAAGLGD